MIYRNCNLCGQDNYVIISKWGIPLGKRVQNVICKQCGLVYQNPVMGPQAQEAYYQDYRKITIGITTPTEEYEAYARPMAKYHYSFLKEYCKPGMNILDVGCGAGTLMSWAVLDGLNAYGVNPDPGFGNYGTTHYGLKEVQISLFENTSFVQEMFDIITLNHVFEHFTDATSMLHKIRNYLKNDGLVYLSIPNLLTPHGQIEYNFFLEHTNTFSINTISMLLKKMGFKIIKLSTFGYLTASGLHHPYIDLVARKIDVQIPVTINNWMEEAEDYRKIVKFMDEYRKIYFRENGKIKVYMGRCRDIFLKYISGKPKIIGLLQKVNSPLKKLAGKYVHSEPNYCTAPATTEFPAEHCIYYK